ncbi:MAG: VanZ family protein [Methylococcaceae bacterium]
MYFKWLLLFCYLIILGFLSLNPWLLPDPKQAIGYVTWDLLDHAVAYGGLSMLMMLLFRQHDRPWIKVVMVILASSLTGILLEYSQAWFTLNRQFSLFDAAANVCGSVLGVLVFGFAVSIIYQKRPS